MDCDGQHEPARIPVLLEAIHDADIVSGSRYLRDFRQDTPAPADRRSINAIITREINARYGLRPDRRVLRVQGVPPAGGRAAPDHRDRLGDAAAAVGAGGPPSGCGSRRSAVPRLYLDPNRAFGGVLNDPDERLAYYRGCWPRPSARPPCPSARSRSACWEPCA